MSGQDLLKYLLGHPRRFPRQLVDSLATYVMLFGLDDFEITRICIEGFRKGSWIVDNRMLLSLFRSAPAALKIVVLDTIPTHRSSLSTFTEMFRTCYRARPAAAYWHPRLARTLWLFLERHRDEGARFEHEMRTLITSRDQEVASLSVRLVAFLPKVSEDDVRLVIAHCGHRYRNLRMNAFNTLYDLAKLPRRLSPKALEYIVSEDLTEKVEKQARSDRDKDVRTCASSALRPLARLARNRLT
jgi:hypothetical protein